MQYLFPSDNDTITLEANPHYYDYIHRISLRKSNNSFELCDGGGQMINVIYQGYFEDKDNQLTLNFKYMIDPYEKYKHSKNINEEMDMEKSQYDNQVYGLTPINYTLVVNYRIYDTEKDHFNGYTLQISQRTVEFDRSPFLLRDEVEKIDIPIESRKVNFFNMFENDSYPTTFYTHLTTVEGANIKFLRMKRYYEDLLKHIKDSPDIPIVFKVKAMDSNTSHLLETYSDKMESYNNPRFNHSVLFYVGDFEYAFTIDLETLVYINVLDKTVSVYASSRDYQNKDIANTLKNYHFETDFVEINKRVFNADYVTKKTDLHKYLGLVNYF